METEREADVYVKTVLTFGDKPIPAMAQIALKMTAEEAKSCYPDAAKVIDDDKTYVDTLIRRERRISCERMAVE